MTRATQPATKCCDALNRQRRYQAKANSDTRCHQVATSIGSSRVWRFSATQPRHMHESVASKCGSSSSWVGRFRPTCRRGKELELDPSSRGCGLASNSGGTRLAHRSCGSSGCDMRSCHSEHSPRHPVPHDEFSEASPCSRAQTCVCADDPRFDTNGQLCDLRGQGTANLSGTGGCMGGVREGEDKGPGRSRPTP